MKAFQMTPSMHTATVPVFDRFLAALAALLAKAETHCAARKIDPAVILTLRLFPDMLPFIRQVTLTCDFAARSTARLCGADPKSFPDTETTFAELITRISASRGYMAGFAPDRFKGAETRRITLKQRSGNLELSGHDYLYLYASPQFFFHLTTAYNILRHNGVEVGKRDYMGAT